MSWVAAIVLVLWPVWSWSVQRFLDGSDEPWGVWAVAALVVLLVRDRASFGSPPRPAALVVAALLACWTVVAAPWLPPLVRGVFATLAVTSGLWAIRSDSRPMLSYFVLALLSLPLLSSLQFYLGYPLRVVTAEASAQLLSTLGYSAERTGSALTVNGALVMVDAPCAGIHMAWAAYFTASVAAAWRGVASRTFLGRLSVVGVIVLMMNVLRNSVLVALESRPEGLSEAWHEGTGLIAFAVVCGWTVRHMLRESNARHSEGWS